MKITSSTPLYLAGLSAMAAGLCFIVVGMFHPLNIPSAVTTPTWIYVHIFAMALCFLGFFGMAGLYARQAERIGWLGLIGMVFLCIWFALVLGFSLIEAFVLPLLATEFPIFVEGFLGMFSGSVSEINLGILPTLWTVSGPLYILGPLLFGIATFRAGIFPQRAAGLLILGSILTPLGAILPPEHESIIMIPIGLSFAWLGYALRSERKREDVTA